MPCPGRGLAVRFVLASRLVHASGTSLGDEVGAIIPDPQHLVGAVNTVIGCEGRMLDRQYKLAAFRRSNRAEIQNRTSIPIMRRREAPGAGRGRVRDDFVRGRQHQVGRQLADCRCTLEKPLGAIVKLTLELVCGRLNAC